MAQAGELGAYLFFHSPFDAALLERLGVTTPEFASIVGTSQDDRSVLNALRARGFDEARARHWSHGLPRSARIYTHIWDVVDGYVKPNLMVAALVRALRRVP